MVLPCPYHGLTKRLLHRWCAGPIYDWAKLKDAIPSAFLRLAHVTCSVRQALICEINGWLICFKDKLDRMQEVVTYVGGKSCHTSALDSLGSMRFYIVADRRCSCEVLVQYGICRCLRYYQLPRQVIPFNLQPSTWRMSVGRKLATLSRTS